MAGRPRVESAELTDELYSCPHHQLLLHREWLESRLERYLRGRDRQRAPWWGAGIGHLANEQTVKAQRRAMEKQASKISKVSALHVRHTMGHS